MDKYNKALRDIIGPRLYTRVQRKLGGASIRINKDRECVARFKIIELWDEGMRNIRLIALNACCTRQYVYLVLRNSDRSVK